MWKCGNDSIVPALCMTLISTQTTTSCEHCVNIGVQHGNPSKPQCSVNVVWTLSSRRFAAFNWTSAKHAPTYLSWETTYHTLLQNWSLLLAWPSVLPGFPLHWFWPPTANLMPWQFLLQRHWVGFLCTGSPHFHQRAIGLHQASCHRWEADYMKQNDVCRVGTKLATDNLLNRLGKDWLRK